MCVIQKSVLTLFVCGMKKIFCQFFEHDDDHLTNYMKIIEHLKIHRFHWHFFWIYNFRSVCQHSHFGLISTHHYNFKKKYAFSETMNLLEATKSTTWAYFDNRMRHAIFFVWVCLFGCLTDCYCVCTCGFVARLCWNYAKNRNDCINVFNFSRMRM